MGWIKNMVKTWLDIKEATPQRYTIYEDKDFRTSCIINKIWMRGDSNELAGLYKQLPNSEHSFWGSVSTAGMEIKKSHSGLPQLVINKLTDITISDYNGVDIEETLVKEFWETVEKENKFDELLEECVRDGMSIGDGAIRYCFDPEVSQYPILEWIPGDRVEFVYKRGRLIEIDFFFLYEKNKKVYELVERRGYGFIKYELYDGQSQVEVNEIIDIVKVQDMTFDKNVMLATPFMIDKSIKYKGRGASKFEGKHDAFDSLDEIISQWIEAIRKGRAKTYIPDGLCPRDPNTGEILLPNSFDNDYIQTEADMTEGATGNKITVEQPIIPTENYLESYITYLNLCLQGLISPATLGIDNKRVVDPNASYERQLEKTTMYTRSDVIKALNNFIPKIVNTVVNFQHILEKKPLEKEIEVTPKFGEYNSPSFDAQIETMAKARGNTILSVEAMVDELYGDSKTEEWKQDEILRIKEELGIIELGEPSINQDNSEMDIADNE